MGMARIGDDLTQLLSDAQSEATLVAPFMKAKAVERLVQSLRPGVSISCITRWHPHEIKHGVSDLEVWDILEACRFSRLFLVPNLHAKFYRADHRCAVGSANLTDAALGWSARPNVEMLIFLDVDQALDDWERWLLSQATEVDESLVMFFKQAVDCLPNDDLVFTEQVKESGYAQCEGLDGPNLDLSRWLPLTRYPEQLYRVYLGRTEDLSVGALESANQDLLALGVPKGLGLDGFAIAVAASLLQMPIVHEVDQFLIQPRSFGVMQSFLKALPQYPQHRDSTTDWQTMMRWLQHFLPQRFRVSVPNYSEVIYRVESN